MVLGGSWLNAWMRSAASHRAGRRILSETFCCVNVEQHRQTTGVCATAGSRSRLTQNLALFRRIGLSRPAAMTWPGLRAPAMSALRSNRRTISRNVAAQQLICCTASSRIHSARPVCSPSRSSRPKGQDLSMLYQLYEAQRALMAPFADFAAATAKLYKHPLSPFTHMPGAQRLSAGFELLHRLGMDYEKPEFEITRVKSNGVDVAVQEQVALEKPFCRLIRFKRFSDDARHARPHEGPAVGAGGRAAVGPPLHAAARHRQEPAAGPQGLHHRLDRRPHGARRGRPVPPGRLHRLRAGVHRATSARTCT